LEVISKSDTYEKDLFDRSREVSCTSVVILAMIVSRRARANVIIIILIARLGSSWVLDWSMVGVLNTGLRARALASDGKGLVLHFNRACGVWAKLMSCVGTNWSMAFLVFLDILNLFHSLEAQCLVFFPLLGRLAGLKHLKAS